MEEVGGWEAYENALKIGEVQKFLSKLYLIINKYLKEYNENHKNRKNSLSVSDPIKRRESGVPVGLINVKNICYFNSLIQGIFNNVEITK